MFYVCKRKMFADEEVRDKEEKTLIALNIIVVAPSIPYSLLHANIHASCLMLGKRYLKTFLR